MPHYANGEAAQIGDLVTGIPYNTLVKITGEIVQITEGSEVCNCMIAFAWPEVTPVDVHRIHDNAPRYLRRPEGGIVDNCGPTKSENVLLNCRTDYADISRLTKVGHIDR